MTKINPLRKHLLVDALLSGKFKQGQGGLKQIYEGKTLHCCLGVACEIALEHGLKLDVQEVDGLVGDDGNGSGMNGRVVRFNNEEGVLPSEVEKWFGFEEANPRVSTGIVKKFYTDSSCFHTSLASLNDAGVSFECMAKIIDAGF